MNNTTATASIALAPRVRKPHRREFLQTCALLGTGFALASVGASAAEVPTGLASNDVWEVLKTRRSVRKFKPDAVPEADLQRILDAARMAATSGNQQPWKFLVVRDPAKIAAMKTACYEEAAARNPSLADEAKKASYLARMSDSYFSAPVFIVVLTDGQSKYADYNHWDGPLAAGNLMLAARALGYGTVFITDVIPDKVTKKVLNIPDRYTRVCIMPLGVPVEWPPSPEKKPLADFIAWETL